MGCHFDQGDCCGNDVNTDYCIGCICFEDLNCTASTDLISNASIGDGVCDDELNTEECNFDAGDCCGHCKLVTVTMENNALSAQGSREGIYHNFSLVNGKPSWTSKLNAIWYDFQYDDWRIGPIEWIGTDTAGLRSESANDCPFHIPAEHWWYVYGSSWISAGQNEITLECLIGIFCSYK